MSAPMLLGPPPLEPGTPLPELHSEEVHEIISRPPHWLIRRGFTLFFTLAIMLAIGCWWIRYPDLVTTSFSLTATDAPRAIVVRTEGKLARIFVKDGQKVLAGQVIAYSESTADHEQIIALAKAAKKVQKGISQGQWSVLHEFPIATYTSLGDVQQEFQVFDQQLNELKSTLEGGFYLHKKKLLVDDQADLRSMEQIITEQLALRNKDLQLANDEFLIQEKLYEKKVISPLDYNRDKSRLLSREMPVKELATLLIQNRSAQTAKQKEILELENTIRERKINFLQSLQTLSSRLESWTQKFVLTAPVSGRVSFPSPWQEQQHVAAGQELMTVEPETSTLQGVVKIPQKNIGKLKEGQTVLIKLEGYPFREYGMVEGKLSRLSAVAGKDSTYWGYVALPSKLTTRYGRQLPYRNGLKGQAEIITTNRRLAERLISTISNGGK